jgi:hypothetical protein
VVLRIQDTHPDRQHDDDEAVVVRNPFLPETPKSTTKNNATNNNNNNTTTTTTINTNIYSSLNAGFDDEKVITPRALLNNQPINSSSITSSSDIFIPKQDGTLLSASQPTIQRRPSILKSSEVYTQKDSSDLSPLPPKEPVKKQLQLPADPNQDDNDAAPSLSRRVSISNRGKNGRMPLPSSASDNSSSGGSGGGGGGGGINYRDRSEVDRSMPKLYAGRSSTVSFGLSKYPHAREISETIGTKSKEIALIFVIAIINFLIIALGRGMMDGLQMSIAPAAVHYAGGVALELMLLISNGLTVYAMDASASIYLATLLTRRKGYSLAICGFMAASPMLRLSFTNQLSLNSPCRKNLQRVAWSWIVIELVKLMSPIGATGVISTHVRDVSTPIDCILFDSTTLVDRQYPTVESTNGVAEFVFGDALGCMRSERTECLRNQTASTFVFGPQIQGSIGPGNTIIGPGYTASISVECRCTNLTDPIMSSKVLPKDKTDLLQHLNRTDIPFLYLSHSFNITEGKSVDMDIFIGNSNICGGFNATHLPMCKSKIQYAEDVIVSSMFDTDGTTASIALVKSEIMQEIPDQTITYNALGQAFKTIFQPGTQYPLVSTVPGMINSLLYWTSRELASISPTLLEAGMETTLSMILRSGIQRVFDSRGSSCNQYTDVPGMAMVSLTPWSLIAVFLTGSIQLVVSIMALMLASTWYFCKSPISPAIRIIRDPTYFTTMLTDSPFNIYLQGANNAQNHVIWQALDTVVRVGESLEPLDEFVGQIKLERYVNYTRMLRC